MRLIDADALKEKFQECINSITVSDPFITGVKNGYESAGYWIDEALTVEERKHGHWVRHNNIIACSECIWDMYWEEGNTKLNYCPNCGAIMNGEPE